MPSARKTRPRGTASRRRTAPRTRVPFEPTSTRSPSAMPSRLASAGDSSTTWLRAQEAAARARGRPPCEPTASGRCRAAARRSARARRRAAPSASRAPTPARRAARRVALRPAHAAAADLVERQPGVERHGLEQLLRGDRRRRRRRGRAPARAATSAMTCQPARTPLPGAGRPRAADRRAQALEAAVGMRERALLLGVRLGGEDDVGVLARRVSVSTDSWAITVCAVPSAASHSARSG